MLTHPSDSLPQIVYPMDEDAIPPNPFCSAPPYSEPPPPLLPLSSITPSCANDGSGHRSSGRIQAQTPKKQSDADSQAAQEPSRQNPSPTERQQESGIMVQASQYKQPRDEITHEHEKQNKDGFDLSLCQNKEKDQKKPDVSPGENVVDPFAENTTQNLDATKSDMDTCGKLAVGHTVENASAPKGWVIGPLFQSFKSKMASFTEIVMSPAKLFRANSPPSSIDHSDKLSECELRADGTTVIEHSEPKHARYPEEQSENGNRDVQANQQSLIDVGGAQNTKTVTPKYSKKLEFDVELSAHCSEQADVCAINQKEEISPDLVPLPHSPLPCIVSEPVSESAGSIIRSPILLRSSASVSASLESKLKISGAAEDQRSKVPPRLKPLPRNRTGNRSEFKKVTSKTLTSEDKKEESDPEVSGKQLSHRNSFKSNNDVSSDTDKRLPLSSLVCHTQPGADSLQLDADAENVESCCLVRQSLQNEQSNCANKMTLKPTLDTEQLEGQLKPETCSVTGFGRAKRGLKLNCQTQESVKRKKLTAETHTEETTNQRLLHTDSDRAIMSGLRPQRKELVVLLNTTADGGETLKPARKRQAASTRRKGTGERGLLATINEPVLHMQTESFPDATLVRSLDKSSSVSDDNQKDSSSSSKAKPGGSFKRLKTKTALSKPDVNIDNGMDLETTVAVTSTEQAEEEPLPEALVRPEKKQLQSTSKCRNITKKPLKRKSPNQASSVTQSDSTLVSTSSILSVEPLELTPTDINTSPHAQKLQNLTRELSEPSKRPKKGLRGAVQSSVSCRTQETKQCINNLHLITKECQSTEGKGKSSTDPVYFEMTPFESNPQLDPSTSQLHVDCYVLLDIEDKHVADQTEKSAASMADEVFPTDSEGCNNGSINLSRLRSSTRRVNIKPRRADNQRRKCRVLHSRTRNGEEGAKSITMEDADLATSATRSSENSFSRRLLRSYSCPEITSLHPHDTPWTSSLHSPHHCRTRTMHQPSHSTFVSHAHKSLRRARRHTVCSVEVEREIAPLCLRKEVYPSRRSAPYDLITQHLSPTLALPSSTSLSALASCFLSSPLAFLSKKAGSRGAAASPSTSSHISSPSSSSLTSPLSSSTWHLPGFIPRTESSGATSDSSSSGNPLECELQRRQQSEEEDDGEDTSSSSHEFEDVGLREEKALSDSEIKVVQKHEERRKVSSIRIRKTLPKPQNNLTPMGLPKPIRLKKKEFSLEEIYTNKNYNKPPESRLETIFEVPLNRRNGSESLFGQRRVKRFLEFLEVGEARKPKKPLLGIGKASASSSRTRRGCFPKDEPSLSVQDVDSLLCAKLDQLNLWLIQDQKES